MNKRNAAKSHAIATRAAMSMIKECDEEGFTHAEILVTCESFVAIIIAALAKTAQSTNPARHAQEMANHMTEQVHLRVQEYLRRG